ncbi:porin, opacity type [Mesorhizobium sp. LSJC269B00]|uniref:outer membrane protein n=1 Tax=Mesorhizobium sp. LSJC269B00 TaxID=1287326 RepID=UPI0003CF4BA6|nr:outer membrane protein [Mesorhizobium sp. LSJC269B00]ESW86850.1 porin, opacity type [Mesorhizobium sp. LSJC269B00]
MFNTAKMAFLAALFAGVAGPVFAADLAEPPVVEEAPAPIAYEQPADFGGWYIRGDIDYHWSKFRGGDYITYGPGTNDFDAGKLKSAFSAGAGVGYQINQHFRTDLTLDWMSKSKFRGSTSGTCGDLLPCTSVDTSSYSALLLLANAYVDIGTWHGVTPYVGAGIGGAWLKWDTLHNTDRDGSFEHRGGKGWRFAYALMAGASYCLTDRVKLDVGYRYSHINGGRMFEYASGLGGTTGAGPGFDRGINVHEVRGGLRYQFGRSDCAPPPEPYQPEPEPIYTK